MRSWATAVGSMALVACTGAASPVNSTRFACADDGACRAGQRCVFGECRSGDDVEAGDPGDDAGVTTPWLCSDTTSDARHCGACEAACATGQYCSNSTCTDIDRFAPRWGSVPDAPALGDYLVMPDVVFDRSTGLWWQRWVGEGMSYPDAEAFCARLQLAGMRGWSVPTLPELQTLVDYSKAKPGPVINEWAFPATRPTLYWSSTVGTPGTRWVISFYHFVTSRQGEAQEPWVRCVRATVGGPSGAARFVIGADGGVTFDRATGLSWLRQPLGPVQLAQAAARCDASTVDDGGWRLPTVKELSSLGDLRGASPAIDLAAFPGTAPSVFWTSRPTADETNNHWWVAFDLGIAGSGSASGRSGWVRCVR